MLICNFHYVMDCCGFGEYMGVCSLKSCGVADFVEFVLS